MLAVQQDGTTVFCEPHGRLAWASASAPAVHALPGLGCPYSHDLAIARGVMLYRPARKGTLRGSVQFWVGSVGLMPSEEFHLHHDGATRVGAHRRIPPRRRHRAQPTGSPTSRRPRARASAAAHSRTAASAPARRPRPPLEPQPTARAHRNGRRLPARAPTPPQPPALRPLGPCGDGTDAVVTSGRRHHERGTALLLGIGIVESPVSHYTGAQLMSRPPRQEPASSPPGARPDRLASQLATLSAGVVAVRPDQ
jgi:hypothetical protein